MSLPDRIRECNVHDLSGFRRLLAAGRHVGWVRHEPADRLAEGGGPFLRSGGGDLVLDPRLDTPERRGAAFAALLADWRERGELADWSGELHDAGAGADGEPLFRIERAAMPRFGLAASGVHLNGYVRRADGIHVWVARRARGRLAHPGKLDTMVGGGRPAGLSLGETLAKEAAEEASLPAELAARAVPAGRVAYCLEVPEGLRPDTLHLWDLELPEGLEPRPCDGEVEAFELWPAARVAATVRETRDFKFNCALVAIDFLARHGLLGPGDPGRDALEAALRPALPFDPPEG